MFRTLMEMDCIPAGMELFPAADEEQWNFIKRIIDDCDYYVLIISGRYGSTTAEGLSYTEKEYDYALSKGLRPLAFLHQDPLNIPLGKSEQDPDLRRRLEAFRQKVAAGKLVKFWTAPDDLAGAVSLSLNKTIKTHPAIGWVRANQVASVDALGELNELRKQNQKLEALLQQMTPVVRDLADLGETVGMSGTHYNKFPTRPGEYRIWKATVTWREVFAAIAPHLLSRPNDSSVKQVLESFLYEKYKGSPLPKEYYDSETWSDDEFQSVKVQLIALGFVKVDMLQAVKGNMALFWSLTPLGANVMLEIRAVRGSGAKSLANKKAAAPGGPQL